MLKNKLKALNKENLKRIFSSETDINLTEGSISKPLLLLSVPVIITNLLQTAYNLTDTFWLGRHSTEALAAVSFAFPVIFFFISVGIGISIAGSIYVAQYKGLDKKIKSDFAASQTIIYTVIFSIIVGILGYYAASPLVYFLGAETEVAPLAIDYLEIIMLGMVFLFGYSVFNSLMRGYGDTITPMILMAASVLLNIILDPFLIFGWSFFPELGVEGAAIASLISRSLAFIAGLAIMFSGVKGLQIRLKQMIPKLDFLKDMLTLGIPASFELVSRSLSVNAILLIVGIFPTTTVAAYGVVVRLYSAVYLPAIAVSRSVETMTGQNIGANKFERAEKTNYLAAKVSFYALSILGLLCVLFANPIMQIFSNDPEVINTGVEFLRIMAVTFGFIGITRAFTGGLRGAGQTISAAIITIITLWFVRIPIAYIGSIELGETGIWLAFAVSNVFGGLIAWLWFRRGNWKVKLLDK